MQLSVGTGPTPAHSDRTPPHRLRFVTAPQTVLPGRDTAGGTELGARNCGRSMTLERIFAQRSTVTVACNMDAVETRQVSVGYSRRLLLFPAGLFSNPMVNPPIIGRNGKKKERKKRKRKRKKRKEKKTSKLQVLPAVTLVHASVLAMTSTMVRAAVCMSRTIRRTDVQNNSPNHTSY